MILKRLKNFWVVFAVVSTITTLTFASYAVEEWRQVKTESARFQRSRIALFADSTGAFFHQLASSFDLLGEHLIETNWYLDDLRSEMIDRFIEQNPSIKAMTVMRMDGTPVAASSNFTFNHPKRDKAIPLDLFYSSQLPEGTLLKRTHKSLANGGAENVIPFGRFVGRSESTGLPLLAVTSGIIFEKMPLFAEKIGNRDYHSFEIVRNDKYVQYSVRSEYNDLAVPVPDSYFAQIAVHSEEDPRPGPLKKVRFTTVTKGGQKHQAAVMYNPNLGLWFVSSIPFSELQDRYYEKLTPLMMMYVLFIIGFFYLSRYVYRTEQQRADSLRYQLEHDPITKLPNRIYLRSRLEDWLADKSSAYLISFDIDKLKDVNEGFGYSVGDKLLTQLAQRLETFRLDDVIIVREYANRFVMLFPDIGNYKIDDLVEELHKAINQPYRLGFSLINVTTSIGIVKYPDQGTDFHDLLIGLDIALSHAKKKRNTVTTLSSSMIEHYQSRIQIGKLLRVAIQDEAPYMAFQPQIDRQGNVVALEALVRWRDKEHGFIPPDKFIYAAEVTGQMIDLGNLIIRKTLQDFARIQASVDQRLSLSMNVSLQQLTEPMFVNQLVEEIEKNGVSGTSVVVEVTESLFLDDTATIKKACMVLKAYGVRLSLDDFGTGYSSLSMLKKLRINELKIDRSFVMDIGGSNKSLSIVKTILKLAEQFHLNSVAEGVETKEQYELLLQNNCDLFQGYYFAKPMVATEAIEFIKGMNQAVVAQT